MYSFLHGPRLTDNDGRIVIVMQMFVAVINENFDVAEEAKRKKPVEPQSQNAFSQWLSKLDSFGWFRTRTRSTVQNVENSGSTSVPGEAETLNASMNYVLAQVGPTIFNVK